MALKVLGSVLKFRVEGMDSLNQTISRMFVMNQAAGFLVQKTIAMKDSLSELILFYEKTKVQIQGMVGGNEKLAESTMSWLEQMAVDSPYSLRETMTASQDFIKMGINVKKTYGEIETGVGKMTKNMVSALSGLAARYGATLDQVSGHLKTAITMGRANYLEYWVGPLEVQMMQMAGVFVGTWQQQFDKAIDWLATRHAEFGKRLTMTIGGITQNLEDMKQMFWRVSLGIGSESGMYGAIRRAFQSTYEILNKWAYSGIGGASESVRKFNEIFTTAFVPIMEQVGAIIGKITEKFVQLMDWFSRNQRIAVFWVRIAAGIAGVLVAVSTLAAVLWTISMVATAIGTAFMWFLGIGTVLGGIWLLFRAGAIDIKLTFEGVVNWIRDKAIWLANFFTVIWGIISTGGKDGWATVDSAAFNALGPGAKKAVFGFLEIWTNLLNWVTELKSTFISLGKTLKDTLTGIGMTVIWLRGLFDDMLIPLAAVKAVFSGIFDIVKFVVNSVIKLIQTITDLILTLGSIPFMGSLGGFGGWWETMKGVLGKDEFTRVGPAMANAPQYSGLPSYLQTSGIAVPTGGQAQSVNSVNNTYAGTSNININWNGTGQDLEKLQKDIERKQMEESRRKGESTTGPVNYGFGG